MTNDNNNHIDFFWKLSRILAKNPTPEKFTAHISPLFKKFLKLKNLKIYLYDKENQIIRDFGKSSIVIDDITLNHKLLSYIKVMEKSFSQSILINKKLISINKLKQNKIELEKENNIIHMPIYCEEKLSGIVEVKANKFEISQEFIKVVNIALFEIASAITNAKLSSKAKKHTHFYQTIKDIAKIIESYYKIEDIIPMIGEAIDKFTPDHLTYFFTKDNQSFKLTWPKNYNKEKIDPLLNSLTTRSIISNDKKTAVFPIIIEGKLFGAIAVDSNYLKLSKSEKSYLEQITKQASTTIDKAGAYCEILQLASTDSLTGMNNRSNLEKRLSQEVSTSLRRKTQLCAMMIDIDYFKKVNDKYGHKAGDVVLKEVSEIIKKELREYDTPSRYGGEEFLILLPFTSIDEAYIVANRVRTKVEETRFNIKKQGFTNDKEIKITISIGISKFIPSEGIEEFYKKTDKALYEAKQTGRNKVVIFNNIK